MDFLHDKTREALQNKLSGKFGDIELFSEEHKNDLAKFERLLESMTSAAKGADDRAAVQTLKSNIAAFDSYLMKNRIVLSDSEKKEISAITGSGYDAAVKKRMIEDLIYSIKQRYEFEIRANRKKAKFESDVRALEEKESSLLSWFRLFKFAFDFGTITPFSHRLKSSNLDNIREKCFVWHMLIEKALKPVLDSEYYKYSTLEYNALRKLYDLKTGIDAVRQAPQLPYYYLFQIEHQITEFARMYIFVSVNARIIERALKRLASEKKTEHGLLGALRDIISQPIYKNLPVILTDYEMYNKTPLGALLSFFSISAGIPLISLNQIIFLTGEDGGLNSDTKELTEGAVSSEEKVKNKKKTDTDSISKRFIFLDRVINFFLKQGSELETKYIKTENGLSSPKPADKTVKPFSRLKNLIEFFVNNFIDPINRENDFILIYDFHEYKNYFDVNPEIQQIISKMTIEELDFAGTKIRDVMNVAIPPDKNLRGYLETLFTMSAHKNLLSPNEKLALDIFGDISVKCYQLANALSDLISFYFDNKEITQKDRRMNYDFFINASVKPFKGSKIIDRKDFSLKDFLETACSLAFHISSELCNPYIKSMKDDLSALSKKIEDIEKTGRETPAQSAGSSADTSLYGNGLDSELARSLDGLYVDSITGLIKREYFEDQIVKKNYDSSFRYKLQTERFVFYCTIDNFKEINAKYGLSAGDIVLSLAGKVLMSRINGPGCDINNIIIRYDGTDILGYILNTSISSALDMMKQSQILLNSSVVTHENNTIDSVSFSAGIYQERHGTVFSENIQIAKSLMKRAVKNGGANICFITNTNRIISINDFNRFDEIDANLISNLMSVEKNI